MYMKLIMYIECALETCMGNFAEEATGNTADVGIKLATILRDGNLIAENPAVAVGRIVSRLREIYSYRYVTLRADSVDTRLFPFPAPFPHTLLLISIYPCQQQNRFAIDMYGTK